MNAEDAAFFERLNFQMELLPLTSIHFNGIPHQQLQQVRASQWIFFTSQTAVEQTLLVADPRTKIAVIGAKTAQKVRKLGFEPTFISSIETKQAMLSEWKEKYPSPTTIFYPKSQLADHYLEEQLGAHHQVHSYVSYENRFPQTSRECLKKLLSDKKIQAVYLTSPSAWRRFFLVYQLFDYELEIIVIGETTRRAVFNDGYASRLLSDFAAVERV